jgi:hypothetical protein
MRGVKTPRIRTTGKRLYPPRRWPAPLAARFFVQISFLHFPLECAVADDLGHLRAYELTHGEQIRDLNI